MPITPPIENRIYAEDFFGSGSPQGVIIANTGVEYTDVQARIRYRQITIPNGKSWVVVATGVMPPTEPATTGYDQIQQNGVDLPKRNTLDFTGNVSVSDNGTKTMVNIGGADFDLILIDNFFDVLVDNEYNVLTGL